MRRDKVNYYLDLAEIVSQRGTCLRRRYGAVIVKNDEAWTPPLIIYDRLSKIKMKLAKFHVLLSTRMCPLVIHPFQSSLLPLRLGNYLYHHAHIQSQFLHL